MDATIKAIDEAEQAELDRLYGTPSSEEITGMVEGNTVIVGDKVYAIDENGVVIINGKKYKIK